MHRKVSWAVAALLFTAQAGLSGDARAEESAAKTTLMIKGMTAPVATVDMGKLREWFNRSSDSVRIVSLLSPT